MDTCESSGDDSIVMCQIWALEECVSSETNLVFRLVAFGAECLRLSTSSVGATLENERSIPKCLQGQISLVSIFR